MQKLIWISIFICAILSCKESNITAQMHQGEHLVIVDSVDAESRFVDYGFYKRHGVYSIYYLGADTDTIQLGKHKINGFDDGYEDFQNRNDFTLPDPSKLSIYVDTLIPLKQIIRVSGKGIRYYELKDTLVINAFPIIVRNHCDSLIRLGIFSEICYMVRQAQDETGDWVDIENTIRFGCSTGARDIVIKPDSLIIALLPRYEGDYKTACRLRFMHGKHAVYSNVFYDMIDKRQFSEPLPDQY